MIKKFRNKVIRRSGTNFALLVLVLILSSVLIPADTAYALKYHEVGDPDECDALLEEGETLIEVEGPITTDSRVYYQCIVDDGESGVTHGVDTQRPAVGINLSGIFASLVRPLAAFILELSSILLWMAGTLFNGAIVFSVQYMSTFINETAAIKEAWEVIRDLINMSFIFILLYISISTILNLDTKGPSSKKLIINVIIVALTINFSLVMTKAIVDASNIVALQFYKPLASDPESSGESGFGAAFANADGGISDIFMSAIEASSVFDPSISLEDASSQESVLEGVEQKLGDNNNFILISILGALFLTILSFVFFAGALLFIIRFVVIMLLMMSSPVAFVGFMFPKGQKVSGMWWKHMTDQAIFAPIFMILIYLVARVVTSNSFKELSGGAVNLSDAFLGHGDNIVVIFNFIVVISLAIAAIVVSKNFASVGGAWATKTAGKFTFGTVGFAGRQSVGRAAQGLANSQRFQEFSRKVPLGLGRYLYSGVKDVSSATFDPRGAGIRQGLGSFGVNTGKEFKGGFRKSIENKQKKIEQFDQDTAKGRKALEQKELERRAKDEAIKKTEEEYRSKGMGESIGLSRDANGNLRIKNPFFSGGLPGYGVPDVIKSQAEQLEQEFKDGTMSVQELREAVHGLLSDYEASKGNSTPREQSKVDEIARKVAERERRLIYGKDKNSELERAELMKDYTDPYLASLERRLPFAAIGHTLNSAFGLMPESEFEKNLIDELSGIADSMTSIANQQAAESIRKKMGRSSTEKLLDELKKEAREEAKRAEKEKQERKASTAESDDKPESKTDENK